MSAFEIAHLKQCYARSQKQVARNSIIMMITKKLYYERCRLHENASFSAKVKLDTQFDYFPVFMETIPDILIPLNPWSGDADKYFKDFCVFLDAWMESDEDYTFQEYIDMKTAQHDTQN